MNSVLRFLALAVVLFSLPAPAEAALVFCPGTADLTDREFAVDITGATADCFDFGTGNSLTGGASDTFLNEHDAILDFIDADGPPNQTDNGYYYTNLGETDIAGVTYLFGEFFIDSILTDVNNVLYFGFKVGTVDPTWVVFRLTGFADAADLSGLWYTTPKQGGGISHSSRPTPSFPSLRLCFFWARALPFPGWRHAGVAGRADVGHPRAFAGGHSHVGPPFLRTQRYPRGY